MLCKLKDGASVELKTDALDDMEVVDLMVQIDDGDVFALSRLASKLFSDADKKKLYSACRGEDGKVSPADVIGEIISVMTQGGKDSKN